MPLQRHQKEAAVERLEKKLEKHEVILLSDFTGMNVETATQIRRRFREASVEFRVVKNSLARRALERAGFSPLVDEMTGPNAIVLSGTDPVAAAKILVEFEKRNETPKIKSGWVESRILTAAEIRRIADLPSREVLLAQIAAGFQAPVSGLARLLSEMLRQLVSVLDEVGKLKGAESGL
jgi:large subunit ribosomal protein L10